MIKINLENQFQFYLKRVGLDEKTMSEIQLQETKRAFYGGFAQMWTLFVEAGELPEGDCDVIFYDIESQIKAFWLAESQK
jgi:hypothetical protein